MQELTLQAISLTSQAFCTRGPHLFIRQMPESCSLYFQDKWDGFLSFNKEHIRIFQKVPAWEVLLFKRPSGVNMMPAFTIGEGALWTFTSHQGQASPDMPFIFLMSHISTPQVIFGSKHDTDLTAPGSLLGDSGREVQSKRGSGLKCHSLETQHVEKKNQNPIGYSQMFWECFKTRRNPPIP